MFAAAAVTAAGKSRMIACRSLFSVNLLARRSTTSCVNSKPLLYFQKYNFLHGFSCELKMDAKKGRGADIYRKRQKNVTQTWRAVSTEGSCHEGDGETGKLQTQLEEVHHATSSTVSIAEHENNNPEVLNNPVGPDRYLVVEGGKIDISLDEKLTPSEKHSVSMEIGCSLMRFIKGKGGVTQDKIEEETGVKIIFPSSRQEDSIVIEGNSADCITKASEKIQEIIDKAVNSRDLDYSHFVSLPLAIHPGLVDKLVIFQNTILGMAASDKDKNLDRDANRDTSEEEEAEEVQHSNASEVFVELEVEKADAHVKVNVMSDQHSAEAPVAVELKAEDADPRVKVNLTDISLISYRPKESKAPASEIRSSKLGIDKSIFIKPKTFHLTVLMLKLWNKDRVKTAAEVLQSVSSKVMDALENQPVLIRLKGLDCMKGSLAKARVLYAPVEEIGGEGRLLRACRIQVITDAFVEAGLVIGRDAEHKLKLHATIMNASHRKRKKGKRNLDSFDARGIFDLYGSEEWGEYPINEAHLSQRFVFDENGYYHCCASIPFPKNIQVD